MSSKSMTDQLPPDAGSLGVKRGVLGREVTTFCIGGPLGRFVEPHSIEALADTVRYIQERGETYRVLGAGSNLLISSDGLTEWVLRLGRPFDYVRCSEREGVFEVGAAVGLRGLSQETADRGYAGLEFAGGIPGSVGGAVCMNAGAYGGQMADVVSRITCMDSNGEVQSVAGSDLKLRYHSANLPPGVTVLSAELSLVRDDPRKIQTRRAEFLADRQRKHPLGYPCAGSIFRNPPGSLSAGYLIEQAGLKGASVGGARISELHANWIINEKRTATHGDVLALIDLCKCTVLERFNVELNSELVVWR